ncbi:MAG: protein kinase [Pirellulaceae bacterium]|nr:protein kinase [Pirellulaceae bacterium]
MTNPDFELDRLADDFEAAWQAGQRPDLRTFLRQVEPDLMSQLAELLIPLDIEYRIKAGERVSARDYQQVGDFGESIALHALTESDFALAGLDVTHDSGSKPGGAKKRDQVDLPETRSDPSTAIKSRVIGPYKLLQKLGEGGMGEVWMAEQEKPVRRRVALKLIRGDKVDQKFISRFEAERQALAMMNHENIAKVLDAGTTDDGHPYFVMELVQGIPFTTYCDKNKLSINERLELFIPVCKAVQHAHQKGIIHRDLKPSNVLVCLYDGKPVSKVIDFGLAKALEHTQKLTDKTMFTEFGQVVGSVQYMSPEQAEMNQLDIDTRTDIYSLGVMLYELLTGSTPIDKETAKQQAILQILATIREQDPPRPSARLSSSTNEAVSGISAQRQIDPTRLKNILRGELDWIVMKALEKDRTRRYDTANGFANDIQNYLAGDVVSARPPSTAYRIQKYVRRHRGLVAALSSIATLLILGIMGVGWFAIAAEFARSQADQKAAELLVEKQKVEQERERAELEAKRADEQRQLAEQREQEAEKERQEANLANDLANMAEQAAVAERERAETALEETEATLARSNYFLAVARWNEGRARDAYDLLQKIPPRHRNFEWHFEHGLIRGSDMTLYGHTGSVTCAAFSPDGMRVVSGSDDNTVRLWDAISGAEIMTFTGHTDSVRSVGFSPDGKQIVSGSWDCTVKLWDSLVGEELQTFAFPEAETIFAAFSHDGNRIISTGAKGAFDEHGTYSAKTIARAWHTTTFLEDWFFECEGWFGPAFSFSVDGRQVAFCGSHRQSQRSVRDPEEPWSTVHSTVKFLNVASGQLESLLPLRASFRYDIGIRFAKMESANFDKMAFSPDGTRMVFWDSSSPLTMLNVPHGQTQWKVASRRDAGVECLAFSPDSRHFVTGFGSTIKLWDSANVDGLKTFSGHWGAVECVAFCPDGRRLVSGGEDMTLRIWNLASDANVKSLNDGQAVGTCLAFSPDGAQVVSGNQSGVLTLWDAESGQKIHSFMGHAREVSCVAFGPDGSQIVSGGSDGLLKLWNVIDGTGIRTFSGHSDSVTSAAFSPDGATLISGSVDKSLRLWEVETGREIKSFHGHSEYVETVAFSPDGLHVASGGWDHLVKLWDTGSGKELKSFPGHSNFVANVAFSPDGTQLVSGSGDMTLKLWDVLSGKIRYSRTLPSHTVSCVAFSPDGKRIISGDGSYRPTSRGDQTAGGSMSVRIWDVATGHELRALSGHQTALTCVAFCPTGFRIASASHDSLRIWSASSRREFWSITGLTGSPTGVAGESDTLRIAVDPGSGKEFVWDVERNEGILNEHENNTASHYAEFDRARWLMVARKDDHLLVDLQYRNDPVESGRRQRLAQIDPAWHQEQAKATADAAEWFAAVFHHAWLAKAEPGVAERWVELDAARLEWLHSLGEIHKPELPLVVNQMLDTGWKERFAVDEIEKAVLKRSRHVEQTFRARANLGVSLYNRIRSQVINPNSTLVIDPGDIKRLREMVEERRNGIFFNTLGIAEYRLGNYHNAIVDCFWSLRLTPGQLQIPGPHPTDLAILAMSHLKLGDQIEAERFRQQLVEAMRHERFRNDEECQGLFREVGELFVEEMGQRRRAATNELAQAREQLKAGSLELAAKLVSVASSFLKLNLHAEAADLLREATEIRDQQAPDVWNTFNARSLRGAALQGLAKESGDAEEKSRLLAKAEPLLVSGYEGMKQRESTIPPEFATRIPEALDRLIELYETLSMSEQVSHYRSLRAEYPETIPAQQPLTK